MMQNDAQGKWLTLMDFARERGVSLSTLRRYIKSKKVRSRMVEGRYFILDDGKLGKSLKSVSEVRESARAALSPHTPPSAPNAVEQQLRGRVHDLETELRRARNEIAELKTLIAFYEESFSNSSTN